MMIKLTWNEFLADVERFFAEKYCATSKLNFMQINGYDPDGDCHNFPPSYVIFEIDPLKGE